MINLGREGLSQVFGSTEYLTWASRAGNLIDARKLASEFSGVRKPTAGSVYAQGLQKLCRDNPPLPPPPPPPNPVLDAIWNRDAVMVEGGLSNFHGAPRAKAYALGWRVFYAQMLHTNYADVNEAECAVLIREGWLACGWGTYGQDTDPYADGRSAAALCARLPWLKGWKANGEAWAEREHAWKTSEFLKGWREGGAPTALGWSVLSSDTDQFPRQYDYPTALSVTGADIDIQVYGASFPTYTVAAGNGMLDRAHVPRERRACTFDVAGNGLGPFPDYRTWLGPRRLFNDGRATVATFDALVR